MKNKISIILLLFSFVMFRCLKAERSPFDISNPNITAGIFVEVNKTNTATSAATATEIPRNAYYVSLNGSDSNTGKSASLPMLTIQAAIAAATAPIDILVAAGNYNVNSGAGTHIVLSEGISLYGGYSQDFTTRDVTNNITRITDTTSGVTTQNSQTILAGATITSATIVDGFTIVSSSNVNATNVSAIYCNGGSPTIKNNIINAGNLPANFPLLMAIYNNSASPTISGNTISGGTSQMSSTFGIYNSNASSPNISNNIINGGSAVGASAHGIYNAPEANNPSISGNTIQGGSGIISYALNTTVPSNPTVSNNTMDGGTATNTSYAVYQNGIGNVGSYVSNSFSTTGGPSRYCFYEQNNTSPVVFNNNRLFNCSTALYFDNVGGAVNNIATINGGTNNGSSYTGNYQ